MSPFLPPGAAASVARVEGEHDAERAVQAGDGIAQRDAVAHRRPAGLAVRTDARRVVGRVERQDRDVVVGAIAQRRFGIVGVGASFGQDAGDETTPLITCRGREIGREHQILGLGRHPAHDIAQLRPAFGPGGRYLAPCGSARQAVRRLPVIGE